MMELEKRLAVLDRLYDVYGDFIATQKVACNAGCAHCCTRNVTMTTLEGYKIVDQIPPSGKSDVMAAIAAASGNRRFKPAVTINQMARLCMTGQPLPEEHLDPAWGPCPMLDSGHCPLYALRPFGCRCMVSSRTCATGGAADMDPFIVTVNTVFQQTIEHIDVMGCTGNFTDVLAHLHVEAYRDRYRTGRLLCQSVDLLPNRPLKVLMVPPEHQGRIQPILNTLKRI
jgi:hypothetical protein